MNIDALPKILFLHEESEQMSDRRIRSKVEYDTTSDPPKKVTTKKINNTIQLNEKISQTDDINCLAYSNKLGVLITCTQDEILLTDFSHLEQYLATQDTSKKSLKDISTALSFRGKVYLSPSETKFLAVSEEKIFVYDLRSQMIFSETKNQFGLRHFTFITDESVVGWKFHSHAYIYEEILMLQISRRIEKIEMCTTVNLIKKHVVICDKIRPNKDDQDNKLYVMDQSCSQILNEIQLSKYENLQCMFFNFAQIISIFVIQSDSKDTFKQNDVYGIVLGCYDDFQEMPDRRYLNFMKGNIGEKDSELEIRGLELFLSPSEDRSFYYDSEGVKTPFQVQVVETGIIKIILIEKLENIFVVDSSTEFQKMNLYTLQPSHEIKLEGKKYFKGMCLMKNMLQAQKVPPKKDSNNICDMICKDFNGQFLSLYFPAKQTQLTVPFPASILALGDNKIQRRYAIETVLGVQEDKVDKIKEGIQKIKSSPYIEKITKPFDLLEKNLMIINQSKLEHKKQLKEQKMSIGEEKPSLLSNPQKPSTLGGNSLFGQANNKGSLFNTQSISDSNPKSNVQEVKPQLKNMGSIFSNNSNSQGGNALFGTSNQGIFGSNSQSAQQGQLNLFGQKEKVEQQKSPFPTATQQNKQQPKPSLFNLKPQQTGPLAPKSQPQLNISAEQPQQQSKPSKDLFSGNNVAKLFNKGAKKQIKEEPVKISDRIQLFPEEQSQLHEEKRQVIQEKEEKLSNEPHKIDISPEIPYSKSDQQPKHKRISFQPSSQQDQVQPQKNIIASITTPLTLANQQKSQISSSFEQSKQKLQKEQSLENGRPVLKIELNKKIQSFEPKKPASTNIKKLQQLSVLMGHQQYQNMPGPLKLLTDEQVDALIYTFKSLGKAQESKEQSKKSKEELARQKLLKTEHFGKMLKQFDETAQFIKSVKQANKSITSPSLFTISNTKQLLKNLSQYPKIPKPLALKQSKPQNPLYNLVKNYTARMEFFQKQYTSLQHERYSENKNPNALDNSSQIIERKVKQNLEKLQEKVKYLAYYNHNVYPQKLAFRRDQLTYQQYEDKWFDIVEEKIDQCNELEVKVQKLIQTVEPMISRNSSMKSSSIVTNISQKNKKKCHFVFNSENLSSSDDQVSSVSVSHIYQSSQESQLYPPSKKRPLLIKFKPKPIVIDQNSLDVITLVKLAEQSAPVTNQKMYQDLFNRTNSVNSNVMQSSTMKKSIDFRDKIPLRKGDDQDEKKVMIKKIDYSAFDSSPEESGSDRGNSDEEENVPNMGRSVSFVPSKVPNTQEKPNIKIKKTEQKQVQGQLAKQTQKAASVFTGGLKKEEQKQTKKQEKPLAQGSLFGGLTTGPKLNIGLDKKQNQPEEKTEGKKKFGLQAAGLTGLFQKNNQTKQTTTQPVPKVEKAPQKTGSLFGNMAQNSGGLMGNFKKLEQKQDAEQKKPAEKVNQTKNTGFPKIPSSSGLFGKVQTTDNAKNQNFTQTKPAQTISIAKKQEKKPASESLFGNQGGFFGKQNQNDNPSAASSSLFSKKQNNEPNKQNQKKTQQKLTGDLTAAMAAGLFQKPSESSSSKQEGIKSATNISLPSNELKKEQNSLFGGSNTGLFGSSGLTGTASFGGVLSTKKQETKDSDKPGNADKSVNVEKDEKKPEQKSSPLFGSGNTTSLFGQSNVPKPQQGGLFGAVSKTTVQSDEKKAQDTQEAVSKNTSLFGNKQSENQNATQVKPQSQPVQPVQQSQPFVAPSFGVSSASSTGSGFTGSFGQKPTPTFGGSNKFMTQPQQGPQPVQNQPWVPASSSFQQPASTPMKSFASIGNPNQTGNLFGQPNQQQNQQQNTQVSSQQQNQPVLFGQNQNQNLFGSNPLNNNAFSGAQTANNLFNNPQQQPQQGMFGQSSGVFGGNNVVNQAPQQGGNFLSGFNPTASQTMAQPTAGTSLFKPRK